MTVTQHKRANNTATPKRRDAIAARRAAVDWANPSYGGLTEGDRPINTLADALARIVKGNKGETK